MNYQELERLHHSMVKREAQHKRQATMKAKAILRQILGDDIEQ